MNDVTDRDLESKDDRRSDHARGWSWIGNRLSPDSEAERDMAGNREKSRELYKTDSIGGAIDSRVNLVVGPGFTPQARIAEREGIVTLTQARKWNRQLDDVYTQAAPRISQCGTRSVWQLLRLAEGHNGYDGESVTLMSDRGGTDKPVPLTLEVIDPVRMDTPPEYAGNPRGRLGVEYDASGLIVAYHIRNSHPGDPLGDTKFTRYPADRVLHVFSQLQAGQSRGLPWLLRAFNRAKDAGDLDDAAHIAAQVEACFAVFITQMNPLYGGAEGAAAAAASDTTPDGKRVEDVRPGSIYRNRYGEDVKFANPTKTNGYGPLQEANFRRIAAAINYPFEMLMKNWSNLSFAAGRLSLAEAKLFARSQQQLLREMWLSRIWERMVFEAVIAGAVDIPPRLYNEHRWLFHRHEWTPPAWPFSLTPMEEIKAAVLAVDENIRTKADVIAEFTGGDLEDVFARRKVERELEVEYGIDPVASEVPNAGGRQEPDPKSPQDHEQEAQVAA